MQIYMGEKNMGFLKKKKKFHGLLNASPYDYLIKCFRKRDCHGKFPILAKFSDRLQTYASLDQFPKGEARCRSPA